MYILYNAHKQPSFTECTAVLSLTSEYAYFNIIFLESFPIKFCIYLITVFNILIEPHSSDSLTHRKIYY